VELQRLQIFSGLESDSLSGWNIDFGTGSRITANPGFARFYRKHAKATQFNPIVCLQGVFHAIKYRIDSLFGFRLTDAGALDDLIDEIEFDH
jgi:hypothetical protein